MRPARKGNALIRWSYETGGMCHSRGRTVDPGADGPNRDRIPGYADGRRVM